MLHLIEITSIYNKINSMDLDSVKIKNKEK